MDDEQVTPPRATLGPTIPRSGPLRALAESGDVLDLGLAGTPLHPRDALMSIQKWQPLIWATRTQTSARSWGSSRPESSEAFPRSLAARRIGGQCA